MNVLPEEIVELVIEFAYTDRFVLVDDNEPVWVYHPPYKGAPYKWYTWDDEWGMMDPDGGWVFN